MKLALTITALVVVVVVVIVGVAFVWYPTTLQPHIILTEALYSTSGGCGFLDQGFYTYTWTFNLVNTGDADGFATVTAYIAGSASGAVQYFVPAHTTVAKGFSFDGQAGCPASDSPDIAVTSYAKA